MVNSEWTRQDALTGKPFLPFLYFPFTIHYSLITLLLFKGDAHEPFEHQIIHDLDRAVKLRRDEAGGAPG